MKPSLVLFALVLLLSTSIAQQDQHAHECAADFPRANGDAFLDADGDGFPDALPVLDPSTSCYARGQWISAWLSYPLVHYSGLVAYWCCTPLIWATHQLHQIGKPLSPAHC